jgi:hypothetical protein
MQVKRVIVTTDKQGNIVGLPKLPPDTRLEAIFLLSDERGKSATQRVPPAHLQNSVAVLPSNTDLDLLEPTTSDFDQQAALERTAQQIAGNADAFK